MGQNNFRVGDLVALNWSIEYRRIVKVIRKTNFNQYLLEGEKTYRLASDLRKMSDYTAVMIANNR